MKFISEKKALEHLRRLIADFKSEISNQFEYRAKDCLTCDVKGSCCLDAHFVNVHISRLEAINIQEAISNMPVTLRQRVEKRISDVIEKYGLVADGDTYDQTFACPLFEREVGCLIHDAGKPVACTMHACYENAADLPPHEMQAKQEQRIDDLNARTYGRRDQWLPIPLAIRR